LGGVFPGRSTGSQPLGKLTEGGFFPLAYDREGGLLNVRVTKGEGGNQWVRGGGGGAGKQEWVGALTPGKTMYKGGSRKGRTPKNPPHPKGNGGWGVNPLPPSPGRSASCIIRRGKGFGLRNVPTTGRKNGGGGEGGTTVKLSSVSPVPGRDTSCWCFLCEGGKRRIDRVNSQT